MMRVCQCAGTRTWVWARRHRASGPGKEAVVSRHGCTGHGAAAESRPAVPLRPPFLLLLGVFVKIFFIRESEDGLSAKKSGVIPGVAPAAARRCMCAASARPGRAWTPCSQNGTLARRGRGALPGCTVCFFVLCKRHWINRVPGAHQGDSLCIPFTLTLTLVMPSYL